MDFGAAVAKPDFDAADIVRVRNGVQAPTMGVCYDINLLFIATGGLSKNFRRSFPLLDLIRKPLMSVANRVGFRYVPLTHLSCSLKSWSGQAPDVVATNFFGFSFFLLRPLNSGVSNSGQLAPLNSRATQFEVLVLSCTCFGIEIHSLLH